MYYVMPQPLFTNIDKTRTYNNNEGDVTSPTFTRQQKSNFMQAPRFTCGVADQLSIVPPHYELVKPALRDFYVPLPSAGPHDTTRSGVITITNCRSNAISRYWA
jgi:hypothetical protein